MGHPSMSRWWYTAFTSTLSLSDYLMSISIKTLQIYKIY